MTVDARFRPLRTALLILLPLSLVIGIMFAGVGSAIWPPVAGWGAQLMCSGSIVDASRHYSTPSGGTGVEIHTLCVSGEGKEQETREVTWQAIFVTGPIYAAIVFVAMLVFALPRMRRTAATKADMSRLASAFPLPNGGRTAAPQVADILGLVETAMREGHANVFVRGMPLNPAPDADPTARLEELRRLHQAGLISDTEFAAKKADILAGL